MASAASTISRTGWWASSPEKSTKLRRRSVLLQAHLALEEMTLTKQQLRFKQKVAVEYSDLIYNGLWFSAMHQDLAAYVQSTQRFVTGTVRVKLFKGHIDGGRTQIALFAV